MSNYIGNELEIFEQAYNWKKYYSSFIIPFLGQNVAEIGAGLAGTTKVLCDGTQQSWLCVEPDPELVKAIDYKIEKALIPSICKSYTGYSKDLQVKFDSILYIDVIEHIEDDANELKVASELVKHDGYLFIIVPAHQFLFSPFDLLIGHFRRYNRKSLKKVIPSSFEIERCIYLDSIGYFASLFNKLFLKQSLPSLKQVKFWDRYLVPVSRITDKLLGYHFGKSVFLIARKK
jgi:hypothetical protein